MERAWVEGYDSERLRLAGKNDEGDWWLKLPSGLIIMQEKAVKNLSLPGALREARKQAENYAKARGLDEIPRFMVHMRPPGFGRARLDEWPVAQTFGQLLERG